MVKRTLEPEEEKAAAHPSSGPGAGKPTFQAEAVANLAFFLFLILILLLASTGGRTNDSPPPPRPSVTPQ